MRAGGPTAAPAAAVTSPVGGEIGARTERLGARGPGPLPARRFKPAEAEKKAKQLEEAAAREAQQQANGSGGSRGKKAKKAAPAAA